MRRGKAQIFIALIAALANMTDNYIPDQHRRVLAAKKRVRM